MTKAKPNCNCDTCGEPIRVTPSKLLAHKNHFCDMTCYMTFRCNRGKLLDSEDAKDIQRLYFKQGWTQDRIAKYYNISQSHVSRVVRGEVFTGEYRARKKRMNHEKSGFLEWIKNGIKAEAIAHHFECSVGTVYYWRKKLSQEATA